MLEEEQEGEPILSEGLDDYLAPLHLEQDDEDEFVRSISGYAPPRKASAVSVILMTISASVGVAVLSLADSFAQLGWALGILLFAACALLNVYSGLLLYEAQSYFPRLAIGPVELAHVAIGNTHFTGFTSFVLQGYLFLLLGLQFLVLAILLQATFHGLTKSEWCLSSWSGLAAVVLIPLTQIRTFTEMSAPLWLNLASFYTAAIILLFVFIKDLIAEDVAVTQVVASELTVFSFFSALSKICFAFFGTDLYLQFIAEMKRPSNFPRVIWVSNGIVSFTYALFAAIGYLRKGAMVNVFIIKDMERGALYRAVNGIMFLHVISAYGVNAQALNRWLHIKVDSKSVNQRGLKGSLVWFCVSLSTILSSYLIANGLPLFSEMASLIGSLQTPFLAYIFPVVALYKSRQRVGVHSSTWSKVCLLSIFMFGVVLTIIGTSANVYFIYMQYKSLDPPFVQCFSDANYENKTSSVDNSTQIFANTTTHD